jgi:protein-disulfide isomerase
MKFFRKLLIGCVAVAAAAAPAAAQQSLQQQNEQILNELKAIRLLLERLAGPVGSGGPTPTAPAPAPAPVNDNVTLASVGGFMLGKPDAPLTMVEYTDLQCPFCRQFHITAYEQLKKEWIDTGKLRYVVRDLPIESIHPFAMPAARASRCAGEQGKVWDMRHSILVNNAQLSAASFATFARDLKLDLAAFNKCTADTAKFQADITKDMNEASSVSISATPSFVIGRTSGGSMDGVRVIGALPYATFDAKLKEIAAKAP